MKKLRIKTKDMVLMGIITALLIVFSMTPIGTIPIGPLSASLNVIPVAIAAVALGPVGGAIAGGIFGVLSFLQCFGIGIPSNMGTILVGINPVLAFIQRFIPRVLDGLLVGFIFKGVSKKSNPYLASTVTGFCTALLNTVFFMGALMLLFGNTEYVQNLMAEKGTDNVILFIIFFVGPNAIMELVASTIVTGGVGSALYRAKLIQPPTKLKTAKKAE